MVYLVGESLAFRGLFVFALLLTAWRLWERMRAGQASRLDDFMPSSDAVWSVTNNIAVMVANTFIWGAAFAGFFALMNDFWTGALGLEKVALAAGWPAWAQFILALFILDFGNYWSHRLLHRPWMWEIHSLHHSDRHMNCMTAYRIHGLEIVQMAMVATVITGWIELPAVVVGAAGALRMWNGFYVHSGLPFDHGRFRKLLCSPNYHRWHHADDPAVYGKNLSDMFPLWDILFDTYHDPGWCDVPTGVSDAPDDVVRGQLHPFRRYGEWIWAWVRARRDEGVAEERAAEPARELVD
ncbi:MAG: sterol desaturase family protein, partial [Litorimonas sp.]